MRKQPEKYMPGVGASQVVHFIQQDNIVQELEKTLQDKALLL